MRLGVPGIQAYHPQHHELAARLQCLDKSVRGRIVEAGSGAIFAILPPTSGMMVEKAGRSMESSVRGCEAMYGHVMGGDRVRFGGCRSRGRL